MQVKILHCQIESNGKISLFMSSLLHDFFTSDIISFALLNQNFPQRQILYVVRLPQVNFLYML